MDARTRDIIQIRAFKAAYKLLYDLPNEERFVIAIAQTSDDKFDEAEKKNPGLVKEWELQYSRSAKREEGEDYGKENQEENQEENDKKIRDPQDGQKTQNKSESSQETQEGYNSSASKKSQEAYPDSDT